MPADPPRSNEERINPDRSPSNDRNAQRGDKGSFGGDQPLRGDLDENIEAVREPQRNPDQGSRDLNE